MPACTRSLIVAMALAGSLAFTAAAGAQSGEPETLELAAGGAVTGTVD